MALELCKSPTTPVTPTTDSTTPLGDRICLYRSFITSPPPSITRPFPSSVPFRPMMPSSQQILATQAECNLTTFMPRSFFKLFFWVRKGGDTKVVCLCMFEKHPLGLERDERERTQKGEKKEIWKRRAFRTRQVIADQAGRRRRYKLPPFQPS